MSDAIDAVSRSERGYPFALTALQLSANRAIGVARFVSITTRLARTTVLFPALPIFGDAVFILWLVSHNASPQNDGWFWAFWVTIAVGFILVLTQGWVDRHNEAAARQTFWFHKGVYALRQIATSGDNRLTPVQLAHEETGPLEEPLTVGPLQRLSADAGAPFRAFGLLILLMGIVLGALYIGLLSTATFRAGSPYLFIGGAVALLFAGALNLITGFQWQRAFTILADEDGVEWPRFAVGGLSRHMAHASWKDARAFVTLKANKDSKSSDVDEIFLLDTTTEALAWRITPKTPTNMREAHERFIRMANEHVPLRDITASLKDLLESPETRSYEYALTALSGPAPVPPAVRKVLITPIRESHFLRGYLIVAATLLALLVAAGLLLQSGLIPAGTF